MVKKALKLFRKIDGNKFKNAQDDIEKLDAGVQKRNVQTSPI